MGSCSQEERSDRRGIVVSSALIVGGVLVALSVIIAARSPVPADGSPCPEASFDEIKAWVESKEDFLASGTSVDAVTNEVERLCQASAFSNTPQDFTIGLLEFAESMATGREGGVAVFSSEELEKEIAGKVQFRTEEPIDPEDVSCEDGITSFGGATASCSVSRSDGLELPLVVSFTDGKILIDIDPSFSGP